MTAKIADEPRTCGKGLAERSALPARLSALTAAMADVLDMHQQALDLTDANARAEHLAYLQLASDYRGLASRLRATADRMLGYRDLPMARHLTERMLAPENRDALANLVQCERDLAALLRKTAEEDEAMLAVSKESP
jgi:hypothetical protein